MNQEPKSRGGVQTPSGTFSLVRPGIAYGRTSPRAALANVAAARYRQVLAARANEKRAVRTFHDALLAAVDAGATGEELASLLGITRQAVSSQATRARGLAAP